MKLGTTVEITALDMMRCVKDAGLHSIDVQGLVNPESSLYALSDEELACVAKRAKEELDALGLVASQLHGPWRYPPQDDTSEKRAHWLSLCERAIWVTSLCGCRHFVIHPLMPFGEAETDAAYAHALNLEFFRELCALGEKHGVIICIENMPFREQHLARVAPMLEFVKEVNSPWLRVCLDTGHAACLGDDPAEAVRLLGSYLAVLHVHDNDGERDRHWLPGLGIIDWEAFMHALVEIGFEGTLSLEIGYRYFKELETGEYFAKISEAANRLHSCIR